GCGSPSRSARGSSQATGTAATLSARGLPLRSRARHLSLPGRPRPHWSESGEPARLRRSPLPGTQTDLRCLSKSRTVSTRSEAIEVSTDRVLLGRNHYCEVRSTDEAQDRLTRGTAYLQSSARHRRAR